MKKLTAILLVLLYSAATLGVAAQRNYCGDRMTSVSIGFDVDEAMSCCICPDFVEEDDNCCSNEAVWLKDDTSEHQQSGLNLNFSASCCNLVIFAIHVPQSPTTLSLPISGSSYFSPPDLLALHCTFLI